MKLSLKAIELIKESMKLRNRLSLDLDKHYTTILRMVEENNDNGLLTTITALRIIAEETGLTQSEILTEEKTEA